MIKLLNFGVRVRAPNLFHWVIMSKNSEKVYYAVGRGREIGVYDSWKECKEQIDGISNAKYRKFFSLGEAKEFVEFWSTYESPCKNRDDSQGSVSSFHQKERKMSFNGVQNFPTKNLPVAKKKSYVLGIDTPQISEKGDVTLTPYTSPFAWSQVYNDFNQKQKNCFSNGNRFNFYENRNLKRDRRGNHRKYLRSRSLNSIKTPNSQDSLVSESTPKQCLPVMTTSVCENESFNISEIAKTIKTEVIEVKQESEPKESTELLELNNKLSSRLDILKQELNIITKQTTKDSEEVLNQIKLLLQGLLPGTNVTVNPQMEIEESVNRSAANEEQQKAMPETSPPTPPPSAVPPQLQTPLSSSSKISESQSTHLSPATFDQRSVDIMALTLRMDAFEKRFDSCLKELGAVMSEISNIKAEIKDIRESTTSSSTNSPRKSKEGLLQTTLNFKQNYSKKDETLNSIRSYTTSRDTTDSDEKRTGKTLKRKLSRSDSESSKKHKDGEEDEDRTSNLLSKIKMESVDYTSFNVDVHEYVEVYTDGACHSNGKNNAKAGIGIWFGDSHPLNVSEPVVGSPTNNTAEIQAARIAIELAIKAGISKLKILTDSEFLINCATKWVHRWKKNGWTLVNGGQVKNKKELEKLDAVASKILVRWEKVEAHAGIKGNEIADRLANEGASSKITAEELGMKPADMKTPFSKAFDRKM